MPFRRRGEAERPKENGLTGAKRGFFVQYLLGYGLKKVEIPVPFYTFAALVNR
jgi:hypothetical protein